MFSNCVCFVNAFIKDVCFDVCYTYRLQQEDAAWDELVNKLEAQAQQAEQ